MRARASALLVSAALLAACSPADPSASPPATPSPAATSPVPAPSDLVVPTEAPIPGGLPTLGAPRVVADGLDLPWGLAPLPGGDVLVSERSSGRILRIAPLGDVSEVAVVPIRAEGEGGLLGLALSPDSSYLYAYRTTSSGNEVVRMSWDGERLGDVEPVFSGLAAAKVHNGGRIVFGPDGMLYVGTGDAGDRDLSQDLSSPNGKVLRLSPDGSVPADNPFPGSPVFSYGHRNVQGLAFDSSDRLWASEFGQNRLDEVNLLLPGANYGWPLHEGSAGVGGFVDPLVEWAPEVASPSGVAIWEDVLYVAALRGERLWQVELGSASVGETRSLLEGSLGRLRTVVPTGDGALWILTSNGESRDVMVRVPIIPATGGS